MKIIGRIRLFSSICLAAACLMPGLLASCSSTAANDATAETTTRGALPANYPNLNLPVTPAAPQLTDAERQQTVEELMALRQLGGAAAAPGGDAEQLRRVAREHAERRLREIEASQ